MWDALEQKGSPEADGHPFAWADFFFFFPSEGSYI